MICSRVCGIFDPKRNRKNYKEYIVLLDRTGLKSLDSHIFYPNLGGGLQSDWILGGFIRRDTK
jgi:hypothetical protein